MDQALGASTVRARTFYEDVRRPARQRVQRARRRGHAAHPQRRRPWPRAAWASRWRRRFGDAFSRLGHLHLRPRLARGARRWWSEAGALPDLLAYEDADFHDLVTRAGDRHRRHATRAWSRSIASTACPPRSTARTAAPWPTPRFDVQLRPGPAVPGRAHPRGLGLPARRAEPVLRGRRRRDARRAGGARTRRSGCWEESRSGSERRPDA